MSDARSDELQSLAAQLRGVRDELAQARQERAALLKDLAALQERCIALEIEAPPAGREPRQLANDEFLARLRREQAHVARLRKLTKPFQGLPGFGAVERAARRARAKRRS